ncbi:hypothetical protein HPB51_027398 [Rhipicephalus microplus]|uniref:DDE Tnp4 domain-containing protein n=1 Tax=Rhipicephalus microplus TaxID=6941 RepID=A0A9J6D0C7_RHIMP|nr:hypothetical protein HPB51_027398 [Rhipicephalus microplus]
MKRQRKIAAMKLLIILKRWRAFLRKYWVRPTWTKRADESEFFTAMKEMKNGDESLFYMFYRVSPATFDMLHSLVKEKLNKDQCPSRDPISSGERHALALRYLSSGMLVRDTVMTFRVGIETARNMIHESCTMLWEALCPEYMKRTHSIVLMAVADSQYLFRLVNVGAPGRFSDGGIQRWVKLSLPRASMLPRTGRVCPHVFVGDEAFQLRPEFMRPLPGSRRVPAEVIYNYHLSRARCYVENIFGILVSCWQIYERQINLEPEIVEAVVKAACVLHNFLSSNATETYCPPGYAVSKTALEVEPRRFFGTRGAAVSLASSEALDARKCELVFRSLGLAWRGEALRPEDPGVPGLCSIKEQELEYAA